MFARNGPIVLASAILLSISASAHASDPAAAEVSAAPTAATASGAESAADAAFLAKAVPAGRDEVTAAREALKMSKIAGVKKAAQMMRQDHRMANRKLAALAERKGWPLPPRDTSGAASASYSDDEYIAGQIMAHQDAIALFTEEAANGSDADLQAFAKKTLPTLRHHLKVLQALQGSSTPANS